MEPQHGSGDSEEGRIDAETARVLGELADWVRNNPDRLTRLKDYLVELEQQEEDDLRPDTPSRD